MKRISLLAFVLVSLAACGQRGSLYLRDNPPPGLKPPKPEPFKPVPYPQEPERRESQPEPR
jgi:predicted small lipoprotein YifL